MHFHAWRKHWIFVALTTEERKILDRVYHPVGRLSFTYKRCTTCGKILL